MPDTTESFLTQKDSDSRTDIPRDNDLGVVLLAGSMPRSIRKVLLDEELPGRLSYTHRPIEGKNRGWITLAYTSLYYWRPRQDTPGSTEYLEVITMWGASYCSPSEQFEKAVGRVVSMNRLSNLLQGTWWSPFNGSIITYPDLGVAPAAMRDVRREIKANLVGHIRDVLGNPIPNVLVNKSMPWIYKVFSGPIPGWVRHIDVMDIL